MSNIFVDMYVTLILAKKRKIEQVKPDSVKTKVIETLAAMGLDQNGDPIAE